MDIQGLIKHDTQLAENSFPENLTEVTLLATADELRQMARFLVHCAEGIESQGSNWWHEHLSDYNRQFQDSAHFVVFNPDYQSPST